MKSKLQTHIDNIKAIHPAHINVDMIVQRALWKYVPDYQNQKLLDMINLGKYPKEEPFPAGGYVPPDKAEEWIAPKHNYQKKIFPVFKPDKYLMAYCDENGEEFIIELGETREE